MKEVMEEDDRVARLKLISSAVVASLTLVPNLLCGQPPIPVPRGSTLQAQMEGGINLYFEHVGPSKTDARILVVGPNNYWKISAYNKTQVGINGINLSSMKGKKVRNWQIEAKDGSLYQIRFPTL